jgi:hypothetical protein
MPQTVSEKPIDQNHAGTARDTCGNGAGWLVIGPIDEDLRISIRRDYCADAFVNSKGQLQVASYNTESDARILAVNLTQQTGQYFFVQAEPSSNSDGLTQHPNTTRSLEQPQASPEDKPLPNTPKRKAPLSKPDEVGGVDPIQEMAGKCTFLSVTSKDIVEDPCKIVVRGRQIDLHWSDGIRTKIMIDGDAVTIEGGAGEVYGGIVVSTLPNGATVEYVKGNLGWCWSC